MSGKSILAMETFLCVSVLLFSFLMVSWSAPVTDDKGTSASADEIAQQLAKKYLQTYYNMSSRSVGRSSNTAFTEKIKQMQEFFGLNVTGSLNNETLEIMKLSRCGIPDVAKYSFMPGNEKWKSGVVTYRLVNYTPDLQPTEVDQAIASALGVWSSVIPLKFVKIDSGEADIMVSFQTGDHGDFNPFDGPQGTLAHAFSPGSGIGGDAHFDEAETWSTNSKAINLFLVAAHEFGHSLGLSHSNDPTALMYPTYKYVDTANFKLPNDDTQGIQALYGVPTGTSPTTQSTAASSTTAPTKTTTPVIPPAPTQATAATSTAGQTKTTQQGSEPCSTNMNIDAATIIGGQIHFIKDGTVWIKEPSKSAVKSSVQTLWPNMPTPIDAAYTIPTRDVVLLFKGRQYWVYQRRILLRGYPKDISKLGFSNSVNKIDAAVYLQETRTTLFFVADKYYRFIEMTQAMDKNSPTSIESRFPGIGKNVNAAFELNGFLFVSSGANLLRYDYNTKKVIENWSNKAWIGC